MAIERFWELPEGYFYRLRMGDYDPNGAVLVEETLNSIEVSEDGDLPRRLVSLIWMIPVFMGWQAERVQERGGDVEALEKDITRLSNVLHQVLGVP